MRHSALILAPVQKEGNFWKKADAQAVILAGGWQNGNIDKMDWAEAIMFKPSVFQCQITQFPEKVIQNTLLITDGPNTKTVSQLHEYDFILSHPCLQYFLAHVVWCRGQHLLFFSKQQLD